MLTTKITDIANAIRNKTGETSPMKLADMPTKISNIQTGEDVEDEVNTQTPLITEITESLIGKATGANATADKILQGYSAYVGQKLVEGNYLPHGLHVWKREVYVPPIILVNPTFRLTKSSSSKTMYLTESSFDLRKIKDYKHFFDGFKSVDNPNKDMYYYYSGGDYLGWHPTGSTSTADTLQSMTVTSESTATFSMFNGTGEADNLLFRYDGSITLEEGHKTGVVDYVIADTESAYPDGGEKDGYWYERVKDGISIENFNCSKYSIEKITPTNNKNLRNVGALSHSLGVTPKLFVLKSTDESKESSNGYKEVLGIIADSYLYTMYYRYGSNKLTSYYNSTAYASVSDKAISFPYYCPSNIYLLAGNTYELLTMA